MDTAHSPNETALRGALAAALPAHEVLTVAYGEAGGAEVEGAQTVVLHVQGRGDRIHAVAPATGLSLSDAGRLADTLLEVSANWRWLAAADAPIWLPELCKERGIGLLTLHGESGERTIASPATPGIFLPRYAELRKAWKQIASW